MKKNIKTTTIKIISIISLLNLISFILYSQSEISKILNSYNKHNSLPNYHVIELSLSNIPITDLINFYKEGDHIRRREIITSLGFTVKKTDTKIMELLDSLSQTPSLDKFRAITAISRIGGQSLNNLLHRVFKKNDFTFQIKVVQYLWLIEDIQELKMLKKYLTSIKHKYPYWKINKYLTVTFFKILDKVILIKTNESPLTTEKLLKDIINDNDLDFISVPGEIAKLWAIKNLFRTSSSKDQLKGFFLEKVNEYQVSNQRKESYLFYLHNLDYQLSQNEIRWLKENCSYITHGTIFNIMRTREDIFKYHLFRQKYPYNPTHSHH